LEDAVVDVRLGLELGPGGNISTRLAGNQRSDENRMIIITTLSRLFVIHFLQKQHCNLQNLHPGRTSDPLADASQSQVFLNESVHQLRGKAMAPIGITFCP
jgi:hypothetical protein